MKLSTKGRYGLRAMVDLAVHYSEGQITLCSIAQRQNVSESYLEQLLTTLKKAGLVNSSRGHQGGYILAKTPKEITVAMIMDILEGSLSPVHCIDDFPPTQCKRFNTCVTKNVWKKVRDNIYDVLDSITLKELADEQSSLDKPDKNESDNTKANKVFGTIIIKNNKKELNNIEFNGKWLIEKERAKIKTHGKEMLFSIAVTEKGNFFVLFENEEDYEKNGYKIFSSLNALDTSDLLPHKIVNKIKKSLGKKESVKFLDI
jgi:Rrf2 family transcriptional regulator, cysteine metabolism repressor